MARGSVLAILTVSAISLSGCGTIGIATCGIAGPIPMYFGVQADVEEAKWLDVPFSAVADTILLPLTTASYVTNVCWWWCLDEKQKEEFADRCPVPWEWPRLSEKKLNAKEEVEPRSKVSEHMPDHDN
jgi:uncharacterized protein YceK